MEKILDINVLKIKVLEEISRYAYEGTLEENAENIPFDIIQGIKPIFRCCVYREREILLQRVRMGMGKLPHGAHNKNLPQQIVHVIPAACHGCPITRFTVTSNCQNCLTKECMKSCRFDAIVRTATGVFIDSAKCKKCGACVDNCPYHAIVDTERPCVKSCAVNAINMDENDLAAIDSSKCINCGACIVGCPFKAISDVSMLVSIINLIREGREVYAMVAPSIEGQFGSFGFSAIREAILKLGFKDVVEVAIGADIVAYNEATELKECMEAGKKLTTSCCPAFVEHIKKHFPMLVDNISSNVSPMVATARFIKEKNPNAVCVFIGPCVAKKQELLCGNEKDVGGVLTFDELRGMLAARQVEMTASEEVGQASVYGRGFAVSGGVAAAAVRALSEQGENCSPAVLCADGAEECKRVLLMLKAGKIAEDFIEGMACKGGCINGTYSTKTKELQKTFLSLINNAQPTIQSSLTTNNLSPLNTKQK